MKTIVITGASGFVGKALCKKLLSEGNRIIAVVRKAESLKEFSDEANLIVIEASLSDYKTLEHASIQEAEVFYHIAWDGTWGSAFSDYEKQLKNTIYACDAYQLASRNNVSRFVLVSTINAYEVHHYLHNPTKTPRIACIYGMAKIAAQLIGKTLSQQSNCQFVLATLPSVFGPGDNSGMVQNILIENFINNVTPKLVQGEFKYDWVYIDDVTNMLSLLSLDELKSDSYYLGNNNPGSFKDVVTQVRDILNPSIELKFGSFPDINAIDYDLIDTNKIHKEFGYTIQSDFENSIKETAKWLQRKK
ncbi:NAD(P)-dependent oxidoreductase [Vibrio vulnificus]